MSGVPQARSIPLKDHSIPLKDHSIPTIISSTGKPFLLETIFSSSSPPPPRVPGPGSLSSLSLFVSLSRALSLCSRTPRGGVTPQGLVLTFSHFLIVNKTSLSSCFSLSLSLSLSLFTNADCSMEYRSRHMLGLCAERRCNRTGRCAYRPSVTS